MLTFLLVDKDGVAGALLSESGLVGSQCALGSAHGGSTSLVRVGSTLEIILASKVRTHGFRRRLKAESGSSGSKIGRVLRLIPLLLLRHVLLLGDQVVDAFLVLDHL